MARPPPGARRPRVPGSKWKIGQSRTRTPACDTLIKLSTGDAHMDIEDSIRSALEKCVEAIPEKGPRLNSAWWTQLNRCIRL
jgi:hypothetical protein